MDGQYINIIQSELDKNVWSPHFFINSKALIRGSISIRTSRIAKPILSSSWFPVNTEKKLSNPSAAHGARREVPTFILLNDAHTLGQDGSQSHLATLSTPIGLPTLVHGWGWACEIGRSLIKSFQQHYLFLDSFREIPKLKTGYNLKPTKRRKSRTMCQVHEVGSPVGLLLVIQQIESGSLVLRCSNHTCQIPLTCEELQPFVVLATDLVWDLHQLLGKTWHCFDFFT